MTVPRGAGDVEQSYWLALMYGSGAGMAQAKAIIGQWCLAEERPLAALFELSPQELRRRLKPGEAERVLAAGKQVQAQAALVERLQAGGVSVVTRADRHYPRSLAESLPPEQQPFLLFCRGAVDLLALPAVALLGSRNSGPAACDFAGKLATSLAGDGLNLVSGYARGVGQAAVRGALDGEEGQATIVLPQGIDTFRGGAGSLQDRLEQGRLLILSPFRPDAARDEKLAPARNRLIVGLAQAVVVIACGSEGHTWDGAAEALAQGKPLLAWDVGPEVEPSAAGNQALIERGGLPVADVEEAASGLEAALEEALDRGAEPVSPSPEEPANASPFDAAAALDLLARSGQVPKALRERLQGYGKGQD